MSILQRGMGTIPAEEILIDANEAALRLGTARGYTNDEIRQCAHLVMQTAKCRYTYIQTSVSLGESGRCDTGFGEFVSFDLHKNLQGCQSAYVFAVTLGSDIDRLIARQKWISHAKMFIIDALSSAMAETLCETVDQKLKRGKQCRPRFSPGYGDLPLAVQPQLLQVTEAFKIGITLNDSLFMSPCKSITAIMGVLDENNG